MKIGLVDGTAAHEKDEQIVNALKKAKRKVGGGSDTVIAIKNESGDIYRYASINGIHQEMSLAESLDELGLVDETAQGARKPKGVWAVFGAGRDMSLAAILREIEQKKSGKRAV